MNKFEQMREQLKKGVAVVAAPQLFPTPPALAERMRYEAGISKGDRILEPSAGTGRLLDELSDCDVVAVEYDSQLASSLLDRYPKVNVFCYDFMIFQPEMVRPFDAVLMNPPFKNGQDIDHVIHACKFLKEGGRLVSIMCEGPFFRSDNKSKAFREWLESIGGVSEKLPSETFKSSGTSVNTRLVTIEK